MIGEPLGIPSLPEINASERASRESGLRRDLRKIGKRVKDAVVLEGEDGYKLREGFTNATVLATSTSIAGLGVVFARLGIEGYQAQLGYRRELEPNVIIGHSVIALVNGIYCFYGAAGVVVGGRMAINTILGDLSPALKSSERMLPLAATDPMLVESWTGGPDETKDPAVRAARFTKMLARAERLEALQEEARTVAKARKIDSAMQAVLVSESMRSVSPSSVTFPGL